MWKRCRFRILIVVAVFPAHLPLLHAQTDDEAGKLTADQSAAYSKAGKDFNAHDWATAFDEFKTLHEQVPANINIAEFLGEAALNLNKQAFALDLLLPITQASPSRWQAVALLARAYAETQQDANRDAQLAALQAMHDSGRHPKLSQKQTILLERHVRPDGGDVSLWYSLEPWGRFKAYLYARYTDAAGKEQAYMTLESSDMDQTLWAKDHAKEAAAGERLFSLDSYTVPVANSGGSFTATHATMGFFDGKPDYNLIRDRMLGVLMHAGPSKPFAMPADPSALPTKP